MPESNKQMEQNLGQVVLVKDINPGIANDFDDYYSSYFQQYSSISSFTEFKGKVYFSANDGQHGDELWVTDGTLVGTNLVKDIRPGANFRDYPYSGGFSDGNELNGKLYFGANDGEHGQRTVGKRRHS